MQRFIAATLLALAACGAPPEVDETPVLGQTEEAISTFSVYGRDDTTGTQADNQCHGAGNCAVPLDRTLHWKLDVGVPSFVFSNGLGQALTYLRGIAGPNWTLDTNGTDNAERIHFVPGCGAGGINNDEPSVISGVHVQNGWHWKTVGKDGISFCEGGMTAAMATWTEAQQIAGWRNIIIHEMGHCMGLAHNPASAIMKFSGPNSKSPLQLTATEQSELVGYDPNG